MSRPATVCVRKELLLTRHSRDCLTRDYRHSLPPFGQSLTPTLIQKLAVAIVGVKMTASQ